MMDSVLVTAVMLANFGGSISTLGVLCAELSMKWSHSARVFVWAGAIIMLLNVIPCAWYLTHGDKSLDHLESSFLAVMLSLSLCVIGACIMTLRRSWKFNHGQFWRDMTVIPSRSEGVTR